MWKAVVIYILESLCMSNGFLFNYDCQHYPLRCTRFQRKRLITPLGLMGDHGKKKKSINLVLRANTDENNFDDDDYFATKSRIVAAGDGKIDMSVLSKLDSEYRKAFLALESIYQHQSRIEINNMLQRNSTTTQKFEDQNSQRMKLRLIYKSLRSAGFVPLDQRDIDLCEALNSEYLLRLSLVPSLGKLDPKISSDTYDDSSDQVDELELQEKTKNNSDNQLFNGRILVFRRGYSEEINCDNLIIPKIDFWQAYLVQRFFRAITNTLTSGMTSIFSTFDSISNASKSKVREVLLDLSKHVPDFLSRYILNEEELVDFLEQIDRNEIETRKGKSLIRLKRYGGGSSIAPDLGGRLTPFLVNNELNLEQAEDNGLGNLSGYRKAKPQCDYDEICGTEPKSVKLIERINISSILSSGARKRELLKRLFTASNLVEPSYGEVVVLWRPQNPTSTFPKLATIPQVVRDAAEIFDLVDSLPPKENTQKIPPAIPSFEIRVFEQVTVRSYW